MKLFLVAVLLFASPTFLASQASAAQNGEQDQFRVAAQNFQAQRYELALAQFRSLMTAYPGNATYPRFASESALHTGDAAFVLSTLLPIEQANPEDWQARLLLARAYAQTPDQPQHREKRDEEIAAVTRQHLQDTASPLGKMRDFLLESVQQGDKNIQFFPALTPWGPYNVHLIARVYDATGHPGLRITLESNEMEQPLFAKQHPQEAAAGQRSFSLDGYAPDQKTPDGRTIQTHYTFTLYTSRPKYDAVRQQILDIASGKLKPMSSSSHPVD